MATERSLMKLRKLTREDAPRINEWTSDPEASRFQTWDPHTIQDTLSFLDAVLEDESRRPQSRWVWGAESEEQSLAGIGEVKRVSESTFEISYSVHTDLWGRGFGTTLARNLAAWTFTSFPEAERVQATCDPRNAASSRVLENIGMRYEGTLRSTLHISDGWRDSKMFSILRREWSANATSSTERI